MGICPYRSDLSKGIAIAPPGDSAPTYYAIALVMNPQASRPGCSAVHVVGASPISGSARSREASTCVQADPSSRGAIGRRKTPVFRRAMATRRSRSRWGALRSPGLLRRFTPRNDGLWLEAQRVRGGSSYTSLRSSHAFASARRISFEPPVTQSGTRSRAGTRHPARARNR
jgi:hypothetical protein